VDEEIYRRLPALLIATVDKFAQMPWKGETQTLFGKVTGYCHVTATVPRKFKIATAIRPFMARKSISSGKNSGLPAFAPARLIIQDELHLISGPLGTLVGLYETAVDRLCSWDLNGVRVRPKVIASTATIRRAQNQVHNLFFARRANFPAFWPGCADNFSRCAPAGPDAPGRLYVGVCAPGTRMKTILIRVYVAYLAAAQSCSKIMARWPTLDDAGGLFQLHARAGRHAPRHRRRRTHPPAPDGCTRAGQTLYRT